MLQALILVFIVVLMIAFVVGSIVYMTHHGNRLNTTKTDLNNEISEISNTITQHSMKDAQHSSSLTKIQSEQQLHESDITLLKKEDTKVYSMLDIQRARLDEAYNLLNVKEETLGNLLNVKEELLKNQISTLSNQLQETHKLAVQGAASIGNVENVETFSQKASARHIPLINDAKEVTEAKNRALVIDLKKKEYFENVGTNSLGEAPQASALVNQPPLEDLITVTPDDILKGYSYEAGSDYDPFREQPSELPNHAKLTKFQGRVISDSLEGEIVKTDRIQLGDKFLMSGTGDAHGNDKWLRLFNTDGKGYDNNGIAAMRGWFGNELHSGGQAYFRGNANFKGGTSEHNPKNWGTHLPWAGNNKNYVRGDTELRGNTHNIGDLRVDRNVSVNGNIKVKHNHGGWTDGAPISTSTTSGQAGASFGGEQLWSHFPWQSQDTYIRPGRNDRNIIIGDVGKDVHIGRHDGGGVTQVHSHWMKTRRHIDAEMDWAGKGKTLFAGWASGKTVLGNGNTGGHNYAANAPTNSVVVTNPLYAHNVLQVQGNVDGKGDVGGKRLCVEDRCVDRATWDKMLEKANT